MQTAEPPSDEVLAAIDHPVFDHRQDQSIDDDAFTMVRRSFDYDDRELDETDQQDRDRRDLTARVHEQARVGARAQGHCDEHELDPQQRGDQRATQHGPAQPEGEQRQRQIEVVGDR